MKLDLTKIVLVLVIASLTMYGLRQRSMKNQYKKYYNQKLTECAVNESNLLDYHTKKEKVIRDSLIYYKELAETYYASAKSKSSIINSYKAHIATLSDSISKLSPEESKDYIDANFVPGGDDYEITGDQLINIHVVDLKRKECELLVKEQESMIMLLDKSSKECLSGYDLASKTLTGCQVDNANKDLKIKDLKKKTRNRTLLGGIATGLAIAVVAL